MPPLPRAGDEGAVVATTAAPNAWNRTEMTTSRSVSAPAVRAGDNHLGRIIPYNTIPPPPDLLTAATLLRKARREQLRASRRRGASRQLGESALPPSNHIRSSSVPTPRQEDIGEDDKSRGSHSQPDANFPPAIIRLERAMSKQSTSSSSLLEEATKDFLTTREDGVGSRRLEKFHSLDDEQSDLSVGTPTRKSSSTYSANYPLRRPPSRSMSPARREQTERRIRRGRAQKEGPKKRSVRSVSPALTRSVPSRDGGNYIPRTNELPPRHTLRGEGLPPRSRKNSDALPPRPPSRVDTQRRYSPGIGSTSRYEIPHEWLVDPDEPDWDYDMDTACESINGYDILGVISSLTEKRTKPKQYVEWKKSPNKRKVSKKNASEQSIFLIPLNNCSTYAGECAATPTLSEAVGGLGFRARRSGESQDTRGQSRPQHPSPPPSPSRKENDPPRMRTQCPPRDVRQRKTHVKGDYLIISSSPTEDSKEEISELKKDLADLKRWASSTPEAQSHQSNKSRRKRKKVVRFAKPLVTSLKYRPKTRPEDIEKLFFGEDELIELERDRETTVAENVEIVALNSSFSKDIRVSLSYDGLKSKRKNAGGK